MDMAEGSEANPMCVVWGCFNLNLRTSPVSDFVFWCIGEQHIQSGVAVGKYTKNVILHVYVVCFMGCVVFIVIVFVSQ